LEREAERVAPAGDGPSRNLFADGALGNDPVEGGSKSIIGKYFD
jgi:hypothetical protein